ncbi:MAG: ATP-binding cassette domain-containing protein [Bacilli bacterium]|nr:ATP-binding cassette domain-containing protein [Bacilli bacterium]MBO6286804.1 ATP-binding cassette domain-containing protein [Bacilli bacterium]
MTEDVVIDVSHLTKDYGKGRGIFDISFKIPKGKVFGYCGTNGAGKTTTLRHIMGFLKPDSGQVRVNGIDPWKNGEIIKPHIGYLPGEIAFPPLESGTAFLRSQAEMIHLTDMSKAERIINALQLDPTATLRRMSKGMKQKTAIVAAFMHSPDIYLLDEPTTGLDPLMREAFIELLEEEKARGVTVLMSNHMFDELDETCDYVGFIKEGRIIDIVDMEEIRHRPFREFQIGFKNRAEFAEAFQNPPCEILRREEDLMNVFIRVNADNANKVIAEIKKYELRQVSEIKYTLQRYFMESVGGKEND